MTNPKRPEADTRMREIREMCESATTSNPTAESFDTTMAFLLQCPQDVPYLLTRVEELEARCRELETADSKTLWEQIETLQADKSELFNTLSTRALAAESKLQDAEQALDTLEMCEGSSFCQRCGDLASECLARIKGTSNGK